MSYSVTGQAHHKCPLNIYIQPRAHPRAKLQFLPERNSRNVRLLRNSFLWCLHNLPQSGIGANFRQNTLTSALHTRGPPPPPPTPLPVVDFLLYSAWGEKSVDGDLPSLTDAPCTLSGLHVRAGVPVWVKDDDPVGSYQIDAQPTHASGQQKEVDGLRLRSKPPPPPSNIYSTRLFSAFV